MKASYREERNMKNGGTIVACVLSGIAVMPFVAHHFRPHRLLFNSPLDQWFVSALKGGDDCQVLGLAALLCALGGLLAGMLLTNVMPPTEKNDKGELPLYRTPLAAAILIPLGIGTILVVAYNHTPQVFDRIVWPEFYVKNIAMYSVVAAVAGAILAGFLNVCEQAFNDSNVLVKMGITCCLPFAVGVGLASVAGILGGGLLGGVGVGRFFGCPITAAWTGGCLAFALLATQGGIFWPAYFPLASHTGK
jgi:hypothetical protein